MFIPLLLALAPAKAPALAPAASPRPLAALAQADENALEGEMLRGRDLRSIVGPEAPTAPSKDGSGWRAEPGVTLTDDGPDAVHARAFSVPAGLSVLNLGAGGLSVKKDETYHVTVWAKGPGTVGVDFGVGPLRMGRPGERWKRLEKKVRALESGSRVGLRLSALDGPVQIAYASLVPERLWKARKRGPGDA